LMRAMAVFLGVGGCGYLIQLHCRPPIRAVVPCQPRAAAWLLSGAACELHRSGLLLPWAQRSSSALRVVGKPLL
jgi:hypothetical protein